MTILDEIESGPLQLRARTRIGVARALRRAVRLTRAVRTAKFAPAMPGIGGLLLVSAAAGLACSAMSVTAGLAAGLGVLGVFLLRIDARL